MMTAIIVAAWLLCGTAVALFMVRRGHSPYLWLIFTAFGPLAILFALGARDDETRTTPIVTSIGGSRPGALHLLLGIDGSRSSLNAARSIARALDGTVGRVTVVGVLDYEATQTHPLGDAQSDADGWLIEAGKVVTDETGLEPTRVVLTGDPARQITNWARDHDVDIIGVATRSHWTARHVLAGSVTKAVMQDASCPVMVMPPTHDDPAVPTEPSAEAKN
jgi:nucleotide-binding universal stress UspA family protein